MGVAACTDWLMIDFISLPGVLSVRSKKTRVCDPTPAGQLKSDDDDDDDEHSAV